MATNTEKTEKTTEKTTYVSQRTLEFKPFGEGIACQQCGLVIPNRLGFTKLKEIHIQYHRDQVKQLQTMQKLVTLVENYVLLADRLLVQLEQIPGFRLD